ncbi:hypothetical protein Tco_1303299 [Tanacetum coccineum]
MIEVEEPKSKKAQIMFDEQLALKLQAEEKEAARLAKQKEEDENIAEWDDIQALMDADYELAERLQAQEQGELTIEERSKLFIDSFVPMDQEVEKDSQKKGEGSDKREGKALEQEVVKKQKVDKDQETAELKYQMLESFDKEDFEDLYKLVKPKFESTNPMEDLDLLLWGDLKIMFEQPHVEYEVWKLQYGYIVLNWKLYDSYGVHCLTLQSGKIYMLVERRYPLTIPTITDILDKKL